VKSTLALDKAQTSIRIAESDLELAEHHRIRHEVFVQEQRIFPGTDLDARDGQPGVLRVLGCYRGIPAGSVRLYELDPAARLWQGDRLAVLPEFRTHNIGALLVRFAVATAGARGGSDMVAHIQPRNVRFFECLGWLRDGAEETYCGHPHVPMRISLRRLKTIRRANGAD
jgi:putative N-acetyltransferase (TIGR04045 family)